jgi:meiotic recombination protein REC8
VSTHRYTTSHALNINRPEQLVLQDDPSFLPGFALSPPELLVDLDLALDLNVSRSGESQSLTPFGLQQSQSSSQAGALGGLVLPTSSPGEPGSFRLQGDNDAVDPTGFLGADGFDLGEPEFVFDENGELSEVPQAQRGAGTPAARSGAAMHSDAGASAKVRQEHEEGRTGGAQVSFTAVYCAL